MADDDKIYLPRQHVRRGVAGYAGTNVVIVDRDKKQVDASEDAKVIVAGRPERAAAAEAARDDAPKGAKAK